MTKNSILKKKKIRPSTPNQPSKSTRFANQLKRENYQLWKDVESFKKQLDDLNKSDAFSAKSNAKSLKPLKEDYIAKITRLEKRVFELENENKGLLESANKGKENSDKGNVGAASLQKENLRLRMKINELEHKLYQGN